MADGHWNFLKRSFLDKIALYSTISFTAPNADGMTWYFGRYGLSFVGAFKANLRREYTLIGRHSFVYAFRFTQAGFLHKPQMHKLLMLYQSIVSSFVKQREHVLLHISSYTYKHHLEKAFCLNRFPLIHCTVESKWYAFVGCTIRSNWSIPCKKYPMHHRKALTLPTKLSDQIER